MKAPLFCRTRLEKRYFKQVLEELTQEGIELKKVDRFALGTLSVNLALMDDAIADINKNGVTIESSTVHGVTRKQNNSVKVFADSQLAVRSYYKLFGMSPEARKQSANLVIDKFAKVDDGWNEV